MVLGPDNVPVITDPEVAAANPELAAMGVMMHGRHQPVVEAFVDALESVKHGYAPKYYEYAYSMAAPAVRRILEELVSSATWPVYSPFAKEHFGRGKEEGRAEGRAEGEAQSLLRVLAARHIDVPEEVRARILACGDLRQLDVWLDRAATATSVADLFD